MKDLFSCMEKVSISWHKGFTLRARSPKSKEGLSQVGGSSWGYFTVERDPYHHKLLANSQLKIRLLPRIMLPMLCYCYSSRVPQ